MYLLQTRDMITIKKKEHLNVFVDSDLAHKSILAKGIGVSGSAMCGKAVFNEDNISQLAPGGTGHAADSHPPDTVPEDIREISLADGLVTSRGGQTSHASVVATRLEKTCVVGCRDMQVFETEEYAVIRWHPHHLRRPDRHRRPPRPADRGQLSPAGRSAYSAFMNAVERFIVPPKFITSGAITISW